MGAGLLSMVVLATALLGAVSAALWLWIWRRSPAMTPRRYLASTLATALVSALPLLASGWMLELVLWSLRHRH